MSGFLLTLSLFVSVVFPILTSLLGISFYSSDESPIYMITVAAVNLYTVGYVILKELIQKERPKGTILMYFIPLLISFFFILEYAVGNVGDTARESFLFFWVFSVPAIFLGIYCYRYSKFDLIVKNLELLMLLCTVSMIFALPSMYSGNSLTATIGGAGNHQTISYTAATAFAVTFCGIRSPYVNRYRIFTSKLYKSVLSWLLLGSQAIICIVGGGRGGTLLLIVNLLLCLFFLSRKNRLATFIKSAIFISLGVYIFYLVASNISLFGIDDMVKSGAERAFAFMTSSGIDMSETSNRDIVYEKAIELLQAEIVTGYGVFHQYDLCQSYVDQPYSHNLFLELLLQGGLLFLLLWCALLLYFFIKVFKLIGKGGIYHFLIPLVSYPFVMLQFSATYITTPVFWFILVFVLGSNGKIQKEELTAN